MNSMERFLIQGWLALAVAAGAQEGAGLAAREPASPPERGRGRPQAQWRQVAEQRGRSFDAGDGYHQPEGWRALHRWDGAVALRLQAGTGAEAALPGLTGAGGALSGFALDLQTPQGWLVLKRARAPGKQAWSPVGLAQSLAAARQAPGVRLANPVFIDPPTGLWLLPTEDLIVRLREGVSPPAYFGAAWGQVRRLRGTTDQFILTLPGATAEQLLAEVNRHAADPRVVWSQPDFIAQELKASNDPLFALQWHLHNTGQTAARADADVDAPEAWATTTGRTNIVIAIVDDAVQLLHPDLRANIFTNAGEVLDGVDNDLNGYTDDLNGWDFDYGDNNPNPDTGDQGHGTSTAGMAAAVGDNGVGVAGSAHSCKILPVKATNPSESVRAETFYYAAGRAANGVGRWRGADVISFSIGRSASAVITAAIQWAATSGRGGKGCAIFASAGNEASAWWYDTIDVPTAGTHTFRWEYTKDGSVTNCEDSAWLDCVMFPDGTLETFESGGLPSGWTTGPTSYPWSNVQDEVGGNHAVTGWSGPGSRALRAGRIGHSASTYVQVTQSVPAGSLIFWYYVSSEYDYDSLRIYRDGVFQYRFSGCASLTTPVSYPANLAEVVGVGASTDFDYRADFSQYGTGLDVVAPGGGGRGGVYTTDLTGAAGFGSSDYETNFAGTSASAPLAAGVAALVLSVNPELTAAEVRSLIKDTCDKIGGVTYTNGWHPRYGYGRVNAQRAVEKAQVRMVQTQVLGSNVVLRFTTLTNRYNRVEFTDRLPAATNAWSPAVGATNVPGTGGTVSATNLGGAGRSNRFYRVRMLP
jgi:subtilisin family serine protease